MLIDEINMSCRSYILFFVFLQLKQRNNRKDVEGYFGIVWAGRWFVFLVEPCAAGNDVRLC